MKKNIDPELIKLEDEIFEVVKRHGWTGFLTIVSAPFQAEKGMEEVVGNKMSTTIYRNFTDTSLRTFINAVQRLEKNL